GLSRLFKGAALARLAGRRRRNHGDRVLLLRSLVHHRRLARGRERPRRPRPRRGGRDLLASLCSALSVLSFGVTVLPDPPATRLVELLQLAERNGFHYGWTYDSHVLWQEPYPLLTLAAQATSRLHLGLNVTNPGTREPTVTASAFATLQDISGGRMIMGI